MKPLIVGLTIFCLAFGPSLGYPANTAQNLHRGTPQIVYGETVLYTVAFRSVMKIMLEKAF